MGWEKSIEELRAREARALEMGGEEKVARQKARGKLTVRERIDRLLDDDSFREVGMLAGKATYDDDGNITDFLTLCTACFGVNAALLKTAKHFTTKKIAVFVNMVF